MADGNVAGRSGSVRTPRLGGIGAIRSSSREGRAAVDGGRQWQGAREACEHRGLWEGQAAVDGGWQCGRALGKRANANTKVGEDWRNDKRVAAGEAAAAGAAGRPSCCGWRMAMRSGKRANTKVGRIGAMRRAAGEAAAAGAAGRPSCCGWRTAMRSRKRANTKVGRIGAMRRAAGEAAAAGAAGRPSCCGWWAAMAGRSGSVRTPRLGRIGAMISE